MRGTLEISKVLEYGSDPTRKWSKLQIRYEICESKLPKQKQPSETGETGSFDDARQVNKNQFSDQSLPLT